MHPKIIQENLVIFVQIILYPEKGRVTLSERARGKGHSRASFGLLKFGLLSIQPFEFGLSIFRLLLFHLSIPNRAIRVYRRTNRENYKPEKYLFD
jgi:hypothetical protein